MDLPSDALSPAGTPLIHPAAPPTQEAAGISEELITDLVLKALHMSTSLTGSEVARRLGVVHGIVESSLEFLKIQHHCEVVGGSVAGGSSFRYRLTEQGHARALAAFDRNQYSGVLPVPLAQYRQYMEEFTRAVARPVTPEEVHRAFSHLVISDQVLDEIGPAVNAGHSIFIYGPPGNGKTVMAQSVRKLLGGSIAVPYALDVGGQIIRFFDPAIHEPFTLPESDDLVGHLRYDRRWAHCTRPMVTVGGELTLSSLELQYNPRSGVYRAPVQSLANGGVLIIDDFGRQQCAPRDLLNWWMVPLESRVEYMTLQSGEKVEMPFLALVIFSTNVKPSELVDEAFLRRIQYKIYAESPTAADFVQIFEQCCKDHNIDFDVRLVNDLLGRFYRPRKIGLRGCQPRDLIRQALALASYRGQPRRLTSELLEAACASYFISEDDNRRLASA